MHSTVLRELSTQGTTCTFNKSAIEISRFGSYHEETADEIWQPVWDLLSILHGLARCPHWQPFEGRLFTLAATCCISAAPASISHRKEIYGWLRDVGSATERPDTGAGCRDLAASTRGSLHYKTLPLQRVQLTKCGSCGAFYASPVYCILPCFIHYFCKMNYFVFLHLYFYRHIPI